MSEIQLGGGWTIEKVREEIIEHIWIDETGDMGGVHCMHCLGYEQGEIDRILILSTQTLRDERDRLARVLEGLSSIIPHQHCRTCNQYADEIKAALTPAGGGQDEK